MRLSPAETQAILDAVKNLDPHSKIFLYGSRAKPELKGGDIDLLIISDKLGFSEKVSILIEVKKRIGDQRIDLVIKKTREENSDPFVQSIKSSAVQLG